MPERRKHPAVWHWLRQCLLIRKVRIGHARSAHSNFKLLRTKKP